MPRLLARWGFILLKAVTVLAATVTTLWTIGALYYDLPWVAGRGLAAVVASIGFGLIAFCLRSFWRKVAAALVIFGLNLAWWQTLQPRNDRPWQPDVARAPHADIDGDRVTIYDIRNCDYRTETDYTTTWEKRTVSISKITGADMAITYWGSPWMAHPIVSFQFSDGPPLCFSIETRKEVGESYSAIRGFYRQFELIYIVSGERDLIRLRTNFRVGEDVYLYRLAISPEKAQERFREYLGGMNRLHERATWYNAATTNCTTTIRLQRPADQRAAWDWRILANGKGDEMLYERNGFVTDGLSFAELRARALINPAAKQAGASEDFSRLIRAGRPGFSKP